MTRTRRIAVLIDGGFLLKRLKQWPIDQKAPEVVAGIVTQICHAHVSRLCNLSDNAPENLWFDYVYRLFYYDAEPYTGRHHHPIENRVNEFARTEEANFRRELFSQIRKLRKFAIRLGKLQKEGDWAPRKRHMKPLLKMIQSAEYLHGRLTGSAQFDDDAERAALKALEAWRELEASDLEIPLRQKGVDMRIGLDIATMALKRQVDTIVLVTGDSDFIPAAKLARREGVEVILDPLGQSVDNTLMEHVDEIKTIPVHSNGGT